MNGHSIETGGVTGSESTHGVRVFFVNHRHQLIAYSVHRRNWTMYEGNGELYISLSLYIGVYIYL